MRLPSTARALCSPTRLVSVLLISSWAVFHAFSQRACTRAQSTNTAAAAQAEPPAAGGHMPSVASSQFMRTTRDASLRTPGLQWAPDEQPATVAGHQTRKVRARRSSSPRRPLTRACR
jgi:hypothetical protein